MISNKSKGSKFENDYANWLSSLGYWCHLIAGGNHTGSQPFDIIAIKDDIPWCIDCKTLVNKSGTFTLERLEENQRLAFQRYKKCGNRYFYLAILWNNDVYQVWLDEIDFDKKSINVKNHPIIVEGFYENNS